MGESTVNNLVEKIYRLSRKASPKPICWVSGADDGLDYCSSCARFVAKNRRRRGHRGACADGGWDNARESDTASYCHGCGVLLGYSLTPTGLECEIEYWESQISRCEQLTPEQAYEIEAILEAALDSDDAEIQFVAETIGQRAVAMLPAPPLPVHGREG